VTSSSSAQSQSHDAPPAPPEGSGVVAAAAAARPLDLLEMGRELGDASLTPLEQAQIRFVRASLRPGPLDSAIRAGQRPIGQWWIVAATAKLRHVHGLERLPPFDPAQGVVFVANHRSFFDLYVTAAELVARGLPQRILFPVRSNFFYDNPLGPLVNGIMSF